MRPAITKMTAVTTITPRGRARIGIVDDHPAVLLGAAGILRAQPDLQVVAATETVA